MYLSGSNSNSVGVYSAAAVHPLGIYQQSNVVVTNVPMYYSAVPQVVVTGGCMHRFIYNRRYTCMAWFWFFFLCFTCPILSFLPFCIDDCTEQVNVCVNCGIQV